MTTDYTCDTCAFCDRIPSEGAAADMGCPPEPARIRCHVNGETFYEDEIGPDMDCRWWAARVGEFVAYPPSSPEIIGGPLVDLYDRLPPDRWPDLVDAGVTRQGVCLSV